MRTALRSIAPWLALALAAGCKEKAQEKGAVAAAGTTAAKPSGSAPAAAAPAPGAVVVAEAQAFLDRWLAAQNGGDFAAYAAMYDTRNFRGLKRTHGGKVKSYDGAGWARDRKRMFDKGFTVAAEEVEIETWLDPGSKLKNDVASIRFLQRWKGGGYADHGTKVLQLWRDAQRAWHIVYEDLLNSEPGWNRAAGDVADLALAPPADDAAALALWAKLAPTGADYTDKLAAIPDDPKVARPMAIALLRGGDFECKKVVDAGSCGEEILEFEPLEPTAGFDDPCLRRRLAPWALEHLTPADVVALADELEGLVRLPPPEDDLPKAAFAVIPAGNDDLRLAFLAAAQAAHRDELAQMEASGLVGDAALLEAAGKLSIDAAIKRLDPGKHRAARIAALGDTDLQVATREELLATFDGDRGADVRAALVALTADADCGLAMAAAERLAGLGDPSYLPRRPDGQDVGDYLRALCLLAHDSDASRRDERWAKFLAKKVVIRAVHWNDFETAEDEGDDGDDGDDGDPDAPSGEIAEGHETNRWTTERRDDVDFDTRRFGTSGAICSGTGGDCPIGDDGGSTAVDFAETKDGHLQIVEIKDYHWTGCPC